MEILKVDREELLATLMKNALEHDKEVAKAKETYREKAIAAMQAKIESLQNRSESLELDFDLPVPRSFRKEYERAIMMLQWSVGELLEISESDFRNWVLNEWGWRSTYASTTGSYLVHPS